MFRPDAPADGRWQHGEVIEGFYLAGSERTAWSEWYRALAELAVPPMRQMPRELWRFEVHIEGVADLTDPDVLSALGLPLPVPDRSQWALFQAIGEMLAKESWPGILYPSASRVERSADNHALCLFRAAKSTRSISGVAPSAPPTRYDEPPAPPTSLRT